jgi:hypothetical protein
MMTFELFYVLFIYGAKAFWNGSIAFRISLRRKSSGLLSPSASLSMQVSYYWSFFSILKTSVSKFADF